MGTNTTIGATPTKYQLSISKLIAGFTQAFPSGATLVVGGTALTAAKIIAQLQSIMDEYQAILDARAALKSALLKAKGNRPSEHQLVTQLHGALVAYFGSGNPQLEQFGFSTTKSRSKNVADKATKAAKAQATREIRNTMGKVQKQNKKFGFVATPVTVANGKALVGAPAAPVVPADPSGSQSIASPPGVPGNLAPANAPSSGGSASGSTAPSGK